MKGKNKMKCPKCGTVLQETENGEYICTPSCGMIYSEEDLKDIQNIEMLEEDMKIWKKVKNFK